MALLDVVRTKAKELRWLHSEVGVALDANGKVILEKKALPGEEYEIEFTDEEIAILRKSGNVTFIHNHPRGWNYPSDDPRHAGSSFSPEDILLACRAELAEIWAITPVYTFVMAPPLENHWTELTWEMEIRPLYETVYP